MIHFVREALHRLRSFFRNEPLDRELDVEMASHIEMAIEENVRHGLPLEEARRRALVQFGGVPQARERHRESRGLPWLDVLTQDLRFTFRTLRRDCGFAIVAVLILALGIGANVAVFSVVNTILLRPLPFPAAQQFGADCGEKPKIRRIQQNVYGGCHPGLPATEPLFSVRKRLLRLYRAG